MCDFESFNPRTPEGGGQNNPPPNVFAREIFVFQSIDVKKLVAVEKFIADFMAKKSFWGVVTPCREKYEFEPTPPSRGGGRTPFGS